MRVFARRERPHPGAQLTLFETADGWRYTLWATNLPEDTRGWRGQCAYIDAGHRVHARVEDVIRTGKDTGLGHFPSRDYGLNKAWLDASMTACILLSWLRHLNNATSASGGVFWCRGILVARLSGRVAGVPRVPGAPFLAAGTVCPGQVGCGRAWMRFQAVMIASAQGQVTAILRVLRRPPRTSRPAVWKTR